MYSLNKNLSEIIPIHIFSFDYAPVSCQYIYVAKFKLRLYQKVRFTLQRYVNPPTPLTLLTLWSGPGIWSGQAQKGGFKVFIGFISPPDGGFRGLINRWGIQEVDKQMGDLGG